MTVRIIKTIAHPTIAHTFARIVKDKDSGEIIARVYPNGVHYHFADYHTDGVTDATATACAMLAGITNDSIIAMHRTLITHRANPASAS